MAFQTTADVGRQFHFSPAWIAALCRNGTIRAVKLNSRGSWRIDDSEVERIAQLSEGLPVSPEHPHADPPASSGETDPPPAANVDPPEGDGIEHITVTPQIHKRMTRRNNGDNEPERSERPEPAAVEPAAAEPKQRGGWLKWG